MKTTTKDQDRIFSHLGADKLWRHFAINLFSMWYSQKWKLEQLDELVNIWIYEIWCMLIMVYKSVHTSVWKQEKRTKTINKLGNMYSQIWSACLKCLPIWLLKITFSNLWLFYLLITYLFKSESTQCKQKFGSVLIHFLFWFCSTAWVLENVIFCFCCHQIMRNGSLCCTVAEGKYVEHLNCYIVLIEMSMNLIKTWKNFAT